MKGMRIFLVMVVCLLTIVALFVAEADAQVNNYICTVTEVGPGAVGTVVNVKFGDCWLGWDNPATGAPDVPSPKRCRVKEGRENQYMAMAITSMTSDMKVKVTVDLDPNIGIGQRVIEKMYLFK